MSELSPWRSVRVRITAAATVVVGLTMLAASFALVYAVRHQLVGRLEAQNRVKLELIKSRIAAGAPPEQFIQALPEPGSGFVLVQDAEGRVVKAAGAGVDDVRPRIGVGPALRPGETGGVKVESGETPFDVLYANVPSRRGALTVFAGAPLDGVHRSIAALERSLTIGFPILLAIVGALAWVVTGRALRPVESIRAEVEAITAGTLHRRVPEPATADEVSRLAHTMNAMLDRLERASERQRQFISDASHELRSPVATIRTHLEVGLNHPGTTDWPTVARKVLEEEARLEALVADLLLLASVDEQGPVTDSEPVDFVALVRREAVRPWRVPVAVNAPESGVPVTGHADRLTRVVANLLENGTRHAATAVSVTVERDGEVVRLLVDDDGPGIPPEDRERVFERFTRLDPSRARTTNGSAGLGLALAKAIIEQHRGTIVVEVAPEGGARIAVTLPSPQWREESGAGSSDRHHARLLNRKPSST